MVVDKAKNRSQTISAPQIGVSALVVPEEPINLDTNNYYRWFNFFRSNFTFLTLDKNKIDIHTSQRE
ncbi:MAG: hypothetical protein ACXAC2_18830 [Candidatus Kariarchaeaceae archaeon]